MVYKLINLSPITGSMSSRREYPQSRPSKYKWSDGEGRLLSAGGLLPYDDRGVWVIEERRNGGPLEWNDIGGKYEPEDGDIFTTIAREFCEELYFSTGGCLTRNILKSWVKSNVCKVAYVNGFKKQPVYVAYCVDVGIMKTVNIKMDPDKFQRRRIKILKQNPRVPECYYGAITLKYIPFAEVQIELHRMAFRLRKVLEVIIPEEYRHLCKKQEIKSEVPTKSLLSHFVTSEQEIIVSDRQRKKYAKPRYPSRNTSTFLLDSSPVRRILKRGECE